MRKITVVFALIMIMILASCVRDNFEFDRFSDRISYKPSFALPVAKGSLTLGNLMEPDDTLIFFDEGDLIRLAIREDSLFNISAEDILETPVPESASKSFRMDPISLADFQSSANVTLDQLTEPDNMDDDEAAVIRDSDGSSSLFPEVSEENMGPFPASPLEDIEYAWFTEGNLEMQLTNNLPVEITIEINLVNNDTFEPPVGLFQFDNVGPGQTVSCVESLSDIMVRRDMRLEIARFSSPGSGETPVFIDLEDDIEIELSGENLRAGKGKAKVPVTELDTGDDKLDMNFGFGQQIDVYNLERGAINYSIPNDAGELALNVSLLNVSCNETPCKFEIITDGSNSGRLELSDADFDFSEEGTKILAEYSLLIGSDTGMTEFDLTRGFLDFNMSFSDFVTGYAAGYFGYEEIVLDEENFDLGFDLFDRITGDFRFTNPSLRLFYENSAGVPVNLLFNLHGESAGGNGQSLFDNEYGEFPLGFPKEPRDIAEGEIAINRETSNIVDFIALPPSKISITARSEINPDGETEIPNFITSKSKMQMGMEIELPLEMQLENLGFTDTIEFEPGAGDIDMIESLIMTMEVTNGFPLGASLDLSLYDSVENRVLHSFDNIVLMEASDVDQEGIAIPGREAVSSAEVEITGATVDHFRQAGHIIISARMNTGKYDNRPVPVKLQTTSRMDFKIRIRADLDINN